MFVSGSWAGEEWEGGAQRHCRFVLCKENMDTQAALGALARLLYCKDNTFGFAGDRTLPAMRSFKY
jgi:tRNA(Glu) U13 pseudouridine synthase TruD